MVAYVSSANVGIIVKKAGLMPNAFQLTLTAVLNTPSGVFITRLD